MWDRTTCKDVYWKRILDILIFKKKRLKAGNYPLLIGIVNPIYGFGVKMAPDINPINAGLERSCPRDTKNVSYVDVGLA